MAGIYAQNVDRINEVIRNYKQEAVSNYQAVAAGATANYNSELSKTEGADKGQLDEGGALVGSDVTLRVLYAGGKKLATAYKGLKPKKPKKTEDDAADEGEGEEDTPFSSEGTDLDSALSNADDLQGTTTLASGFFKGKMPPSRTPASDPAQESQTTAPDEPTEIAADADPVASDVSLGATDPQGAVSSSYSDTAADTNPVTAPDAPPADVPINPEAPTTTLSTEAGTEGGEEGGSMIGRVGNALFEKLGAKGKTIKAVGSSVKNFFSGSGEAGGEAGGEAAGEAAGAVAGEGAGEAAGATVGEAVLGAIPVVGEIGLVIGGIVSIGEAIYHLFHPEKKPPPPPPPNVAVPHALTAKMTQALPSFDSSADVGGSMNSF